MRYAVGAGVMAGIFGQAEGVAQIIILCGAAVGALAVIHTQAVMPAMRFTHRLGDAVEIMLNLPERDALLLRRMECVEERVERVEEQLEELIRQ